MIQLSTTSVENYEEKSEWKISLSQSRMTCEELLQKVHLNTHPLASSKAEKLFEVSVPKRYLDKINKGDINDPLLLQVLPQAREFLEVPGYSDNPLDESNYSPVKGLFHKYANRVLLIASSTCAINCRYCFRRTFPYAEHRQSREDWQQALDYIRQQTSLDEVILSGGDPLVLSNTALIWLLEEIDRIPHIRRLRIHTRMLTSMPERLDKILLTGLSNIKTPMVIVTHCNHPNELGTDLKAVFANLKALNITLLNQSVLLKNINDQPETLAELSKSLFELGILPYYLFLLDKVSGSAHFHLSLEQAKSIYASLQAKLPGYLMPRLSIEEPGKPSKTLITL